MPHKKQGRVSHPGNAAYYLWLVALYRGGLCVRRRCLFNHYLADLIALTTDVEAGFGIVHLHALQVEVLNRGIGVIADNVADGGNVFFHAEVVNASVGICGPALVVETDVVIAALGNREFHLNVLPATGCTVVELVVVNGVEHLAEAVKVLRVSAEAYVQSGFVKA